MPPTKDLTITFKAQRNPFTQKEADKFVSDFNSLKPEDQKRISLLMGNEKALSGLAENWELLQNMFLQ